MMKKKEAKEHRDIKIIKRMLMNYGLDINSMTEDELERIRQNYIKTKSDLKKDLAASEDFYDEYSEDII